MLERAGDLDLDELAEDRPAFGSQRLHVDDLVPLRPALEGARHLPQTLDEDLVGRSHERGEMRARLSLRDLEEAREAVALLFLADIVRELECRSERTGRVLEAEEADESDLTDDVE